MSPTLRKNHFSVFTCQNSLLTKQEENCIRKVLVTHEDLLVICDSTGERNSMLRKLQISELFSELFPKVEILEFYSPSILPHSVTKVF